ncbi:acetylglutamate kinase [Flavobacterium sp. '19STA2R22 D10 B1']|uniref:acetylglutamate kinase n=1 Tax=Flavobacterium aerium TaxID=3037261 RepID=UPI00278BFA6E|nr:acetylglutamate kinase [Flavobacterium sp. '19STA2R22 D10 B1']
MKIKQSLTIVKIGGNIIDDAQALTSFLMAYSNIYGPKILVHGGGKSATKTAEQFNLKPEFVDGRRITDAPMLDVAVMVYAGLINKQIVAQLQALGTTAMGFTGADGNLIQSEKRQHNTIDFGYVGDVVTVQTSLLEKLLATDISLVFCAITHDNKGQLLNTNADTIASELAIALSDEYDVNLMYCFEKKGVLLDLNDENSVVKQMTFDYYNELKTAQVIHSGMLPKLDNCFYALSNGVQKISIGDQSQIENTTAQYTTISL